MLLNVITLGPAQYDHLNRLITITDEITGKKSLWDHILMVNVITISNLITLTVITLSSLHCTRDQP